MWGIQEVCQEGSNMLFGVDYTTLLSFGPLTARMTLWTVLVDIVRSRSAVILVAFLIDLETSHCRRHFSCCGVRDHWYSPFVKLTILFFQKIVYLHQRNVSLFQLFCEGRNALHRAQSLDPFSDWQKRFSAKHKLITMQKTWLTVYRQHLISLNYCLSVPLRIYLSAPPASFSITQTTSLAGVTKIEKCICRCKMHLSDPTQL